MTPDTFIRDRFAWLDQVGADHSCQGALAFRVAYSIASHLNRKTGEAFPGQELIARECGVTVTSVRNAISRLVKNGHLAVNHGNGRGFPNRYRTMIKGERCNDVCTLTEKKVQTELHHNKAEGANVVTLFAEKVQTGFPEGANGFATNPLSNPKEDISRTLPLTHPQEPPSSKVTEADKHFDEFWTFYPKRTDKAAARKVFPRALKRADAATIIEGAKRYAAERKGQDAQYTKYPATWLNGECWNNAPPAAGSTSEPAGAVDSKNWTRAKFAGVIGLAKKNGFWADAYGDPANIPADMIDAELQGILNRIPKPFAQVVA